MEEINQKLDELFSLLDSYPELERLNELKEEINEDDLKLIDDYRINPTIENKKRIFENKKLREYLLLESKINYLILEINHKFKKGSCCESN